MEPTGKCGHGNANPTTGEHGHGNANSASGAHGRGNAHDAINNAANKVTTTNAAADTAAHATAAIAVAVRRNGNANHPVLWSDGVTNFQWSGHGNVHGAQFLTGRGG